MHNFLELTNGLYDAEIIDVKQEDLHFDYRQKNPTRNMLEIVLDANQAMNDTLVKTIRFYNAKIISGGSDLMHTWWYDDELTDVNGKKRLKLILRNKKNEFIEVIILFEKVEVMR